MKALLIFFCLVGVILLSALFYHAALTQSDYIGLPTVPCLDYTKPVVQNFALTITIHIRSEPYALSPTIGHDYGNCLHDIFVNDASGTVHIQANDAEQFTLGQFFDVWKKTFTQKQIFSHQVGKTHHIIVTVNGKEVTEYRNIILQPNQIIHIFYQ